MAASGGAPQIQRACPTCEEEELRRQQIEEEEELQRQPIEEEEEELQTKATSSHISNVNSGLESRIQSIKGGGQPLSENDRAFFEPRFCHDFSQIRVHTDAQAAETARGVNARAFTIGHDIVFGEGQYAPNTTSGKRLIAHELTHVGQQTGSIAGVLQGDTAQIPNVQCVIEVRPPGRGEASSFDRRQELIDRLNRQSQAIQYTLVGRAIRYNIVNEANLTNFDRQMRGFIDRAGVVPMRLITGAGYVRGATGVYEPVVHDEWISGYVDLDDILASDDLAFQSQLVHILTERFATQNYEKRIGTATFTLAEFNRVHRAAYEAEAELFRGVIGDTTIRYIYSEERPNGTWVVAFRSNEGYRVFKVFRRAGGEVQGGEVWVQSRNGRRLTVDQLRAERAVSAPAPAP